ncbi:hypothetical protein BIT25_15555 [Klebsiella pneumoniae]|nr:hypothetical protein BIT25_15555 [Klebsiella pneumoniae]
MSEKIISIFGLFFVTSFVAKYIGPYRFGQIALSIAIFQVVQVISQMGCDNILFKRASKKKTSAISLIASTFHLRTFLYFVLSFFILCYFSITGDAISLIFVASVCLAYYILTIDVYSIYNDAILNSKMNTYANILGLIVGLSVRYIIAYFKMPIFYLAIPIVLTTFIPFTIRLLCAPKAKKICWKDKIKYNKYILQTGISLVISTVSMTIYSRINQFSVSFIEGSYDLGVYSVALTLGTAWGFVGNAVAISFLSKIYAETDDHKAMEITAGLSLGIIFLLIMFPCVFIFIGPWVIQILYGNDYSAAYPVAVILCFSTIISTLGFVSNRFIVRFSGYNYLSKKTMVILFISIPLSSLFTYCWGIVGSAYSVITIELMSLTVFNYFYNKRVVLKMHKKNVKH